MKRGIRSTVAIAERCGIVAAFLLVASSAWPTADELALLFHRWETRDGAAVFEVSHALSQEFVRQPRPFLVAMSTRPETWRSWLEGLPDQTFRVFIAGQKPQYESLRTQMLQRADRLLSDPDVGTLAKELKRRLVKVKVREVE
jgi:hypothetical protein